MSEETDQPSPGTNISKKGTHLAVTHVKVVARGGKVGLADPMGRLNPPGIPSRCILAGSLI